MFANEYRALRVGGRLAREAGVGVDDRHPGPWNDRSLRVGHTADEAAIQQLRLRRDGRGGKEQPSPRVNKPAPLVTAHLLGVFAGRSRLCAASPSRTK